MAAREEARRVMNRRASGCCRAGELDGPESTLIPQKSQPIAIIALSAQAWCRALITLGAALANTGLPAGMRLALTSAQARIAVGRTDRLDGRDLAALQHAGRLARRGGGHAG